MLSESLIGNCANNQFNGNNEKPPEWKWRKGVWCELILTFFGGEVRRKISKLKHWGKDEIYVYICMCAREFIKKSKQECPI